MNINFQVQADFDLAKIPLRGWDRQLKKSANIVTKDHFERLERGKGVSGDRLRALKESTILRKRRQKRPPLRSPETPLVAEGIMQNLERAKKVTKTKRMEKITVRVTSKGGSEKPKRSRQKIGQHHQEGKGQVKRVWFGISNQAFEDIAMIFVEEVSARIQKTCLAAMNPLSHIAGYSVSA
jgi:hypothetical protein